MPNDTVDCFLSSSYFQDNAARLTFLQGFRSIRGEESFSCVGLLWRFYSRCDGVTTETPLSSTGAVSAKSGGADMTWEESGVDVEPAVVRKSGGGKDNVTTCMS